MRIERIRLAPTRRTHDHPSLHAFRDWLARYLRTLMAIDPGAALAVAVPADVRAQLPASVRRLVEVHVRGRGDIVRTVSCGPETGFAHVQLEARLKGRWFVAAGDAHSLALRLQPLPEWTANPEYVPSYRAIEGWGDDTSGQCSAPSYRWVGGVAAGARHSLAIVPFMRG